MFTLDQYSLIKMELLTKFILLALVAQIFCGDYFYSNGTKFYFSAPMKKNWYQAQRFCHAISMHLATIHTEEENHILLDVVYGKFQPAQADDHFWTSGTDMGEIDMEFYWSESGHSTLFTNWIGTHPLKDVNGCILLHGGGHKYKWHDTVCENKFYFICQDRLFVPDASKRNMYLNSSYFEGG